MHYSEIIFSLNSFKTTQKRLAFFIIVTSITTPDVWLHLCAVQFSFSFARPVSNTPCRPDIYLFPQCAWVVWAGLNWRAIFYIINVAANVLFTHYVKWKVDLSHNIPYIPRKLKQMALILFPSSPLPTCHVVEKRSNQHWPSSIGYSQIIVISSLKK